MSESETAWESWKVANPNKSICTHYHEAFREGYAVAESERDALRKQVALVRKWIEAEVAYDGHFEGDHYDCEVCRELLIARDTAKTMALSALAASAEAKEAQK